MDYDIHVDISNNSDISIEQTVFVKEGKIVYITDKVLNKEE